MMASSSSLNTNSLEAVGGFPPSKMISSMSATIVASSAAINNAHCSIGQAGGSIAGGGGMGSIMEIREMAGYCNACVAPDKYWNHQHATCSMTTSVRHSAVYPPVFYTPPPPPQSYSSCSVAVPPGPNSVNAPPPPEWSCPPPPSHSESYSHFLYPQYPSHNDYTNFLSSIPTSCYETDLLMMGAGVPLPGQGTVLPFQVQPSESSTCCEQTQSQPQLLPPHLGYPPPQLQPACENLTPPVVRKPEKPPEVNEQSSSISSSLPDTSGSEDIDEDTEEEDDDRHIISIEDDENAQDTDNTHSTSLPWCILCKKPAASCSSSPSLNPLSHPAPASPQLSKILGDIDDNELDISVCSGDIEIGGIDDEMVQQEVESPLSSNRITIDCLAQLVGVPVSNLVSESSRQHQQILEAKQAVLCFKCQKIVDLAESLDKQLASVLTTLRHIIKHHDVRNLRKSSYVIQKVSTATISTQTDKSESSGEIGSMDTQTGNFRCILLSRNRCQSQIKVPVPVVPSTPYKDFESPSHPDPTHLVKEGIDAFSVNLFLCHECGRTFNCGRNLGKHLKRSHRENFSPTPSMISCTRENCTKKCSDRSKLKSHIKSHSDEKRHFCGRCLKLFSNKSNLTAHLKADYCAEKAVDQLPPVRKKSKTNPNNMAGQSPYRCENCGLTFRTEARFQSHTNGSCATSNVFCCATCSKIFSKQSELRVHQGVHSGMKPFPCDICGLAFSTRGNQRVHQRTHSLQKRFKFGECGKGFTRNQTLQVHISNSHKS